MKARTSLTLVGALTLLVALSAPAGAATIVQGIDLTIEKTTTATTALPGDMVDWTLTVTNNGLSAAANVEVTDTLPADFSFVSATGATCNAAGAIVTCAIGDMGGVGDAPLNVVTIELMTMANHTAAGECVNGATVSGTTVSGDPDANPDNNSASASVQCIIPEPVIDLEVTKTVDAGQLDVGAQATFTITVVNNGPDPATGVVLADTLPAGLTYVSDTAGGAYDSGTGVWTVGNLGVGESKSFGLTVSVSAAGTFTNVVEVSAAGENDVDSTPGNCSATGVAAEDDCDDAAVVALTVLPTGQIGDFVWADTDRDGVQDANEVGIPNVTVTLTDSAGVQTQATTDGGGIYGFVGLAAGNYTVTVDTASVPAGLVPTTVTQHSVDLPDGGQFLDADFGFAAPMATNPPPTTSPTPTLVRTGPAEENAAIGSVGTAFLLLGLALLVAAARWERRRVLAGWDRYMAASRRKLDINLLRRR